MAESRVILLLFLDKVRDVFGALTINWCWTAFCGDFPQGALGCRVKTSYDGFVRWHEAGSIRYSPASRLGSLWRWCSNNRLFVWKIPSARRKGINPGRSVSMDRWCHVLVTDIHPVVDANALPIVLKRTKNQPLDGSSLNKSPASFSYCLDRNSNFATLRASVPTRYKLRYDPSCARWRAGAYTIYSSFDLHGITSSLITTI